MSKSNGLPAQGALLGALAQADDAVAEFAAGRPHKPYATGVQMFIPTTRTPDELRADRRRAARQLGLFKLERDSPTLLVGNRRVKSWRIPGTPEFSEHARLVAHLAALFSHTET